MLKTDTLFRRNRCHRTQNFRYKVIDNIVGIEPIHNAKATSNTPVALEKWLSEKCSAKFSIIVDYFIKK